MKTPERVLIIFDTGEALPADHDYGEDFKTPDWETEAHVVRAVKSLGHPHQILGIYNNIELLWEKIRLFQPEIIFNLMETFRGQSLHDRDIPAFFELTGIPYTGCGPTGMTLCKNKAISKQILSHHRIRIPQFAILHQHAAIKRPGRLKFPVLIKPIAEEASYGISQASFVEDDVQFKERVAFIHETMKSDVIAEEYIEGREIYVSLLGNKRVTAFPLREMKFREVPDEEPKIATYKAKWDEGYRKRWGIRNQFIGALPEGLEDKIIRISKKIYRLLSITGYARLDLRVTPSGEVVFIEANPNPILSEREDYAESAKKSGMTYPGLIGKILSLGKSAQAR